MFSLESQNVRTRYGNCEITYISLKIMSMTTENYYICRTAHPKYFLKNTYTWVIIFYCTVYRGILTVDQ